MRKPTPSEIKADMPFKDLFFSRDTMKYFGDTMKSFNTIRVDDQVYMYRKPTAIVNTYDGYKVAGREFFNVWKYTSGESLELIYDEDMMNRIFELI